MIALDKINKINLIKRDILSSIGPWIKRKECIFITGSRQVGKTSLLYLIIQKLYADKVIDNKNFVYFDMENPQDFLLVNSENPEDILEYLKLNGYKWSDKKRLYLFIDEVHLLDNPSRLIKLLVDYHKDIKVFITGSSSTEIRKKFKDTLPGRKEEFHLSSISFREYLRFKNESNLSETLISDINSVFKNKIYNKRVTQLQIKKLNNFFKNYIIFGGYPEISMIKEKDIKIRKLNSIFNDYVRKDIATLFTVEHLTNFTNMLRIISEQTANILVVTNISEDCGIDRRTVNRYLDILEATFIIKRLYPYNKKIKKRLVKTPKLFFQDTGMRNCALQNFLLPVNRTDYGKLIENFVLNFLLRSIEFSELADLSFWRTSNGSEVDFIINDIAIEVKSGNHSGNPPRAMFECMDSINSKKGIIINSTVYQKKVIKDKTIIYLPYYFLA